MSVHPHVCGEYAPPIIWAWADNGSSPRVWGIRGAANGESERLRFIPTCVGNTWRGVDAVVSATVHPHVCGEYAQQFERRSDLYGSSPRVWGIRLRQGHRKSKRAVHPHVCGEYGSSAITLLPLNGSSPRVWGILFLAVLFGMKTRFIPTCVGNTTRSAGKADYYTVHPHVCGEYARQEATQTPSPRFIPTCVGNTPWHHTHIRKSPVHPHVCGEYVLRIFHDLKAGRFIPTCVGNTSCRRFGLVGSAVHPHVCGEYYASRCNTLRQARFIPTCVGNTDMPPIYQKIFIGSSPRVWGILLILSLLSLPLRFIPTCVGNTRVRQSRHTGSAVHPHVCGEYSRICFPSLLALRFIPTCVGNTQSHAGITCDLPVHPHVCGEYVDTYDILARNAGSSPRVWGIRTP